MDSWKIMNPVKYNTLIKRICLKKTVFEKQNLNFRYAFQYIPNILFFFLGFIECTLHELKKKLTKAYRTSGQFKPKLSIYARLKMSRNSAYFLNCRWFICVHWTVKFGCVYVFFCHCLASNNSRNNVKMMRKSRSVELALSLDGGFQCGLNVVHVAFNQQNGQQLYCMWLKREKEQQKVWFGSLVIVCILYAWKTSKPQKKNDDKTINE